MKRGPRQLERIVKRAANHRRIEILMLVHKQPELSLTEIADELGINFKTASEHVRRLAIAGLLMKRHEGDWSAMPRPTLESVFSNS